MKIEKYLILNKYFLSLFGVDNFMDLQKKLKDTKEGTDSDGKTYFVNVLTGLDGLKISENDLLRYDKNIQEYGRKINYRRGNVSLKYFQYLSVLFTEIFLDNLKNNKQLFLYELNEFLQKYKDKDVKNLIGSFTEDDLRKLAFWMATGSGKTLIAHINYYQFFKYNIFSPDNILFITPNEGLSKQHYEELIKSGIPARIYSGSLNGGLKAENEVLVIEMTKFVAEKKGGGITLPVDTFEGKNLIFVDEGHKGKKSEEQKWAKLRDKLSEDGFVFEYSATFGQILNVPIERKKKKKADENDKKEEANKKIFIEYAKSILFDYSYKYFFLDGYGKDFSVLNAKESSLKDEKFQETMFVANLLSFYEQMLLYDGKITLAKEYNIEKPLWIFVGTTVAGKEEESDVLIIVKFIKEIAENKNWLKQKIDSVLNGNTGLKDDEGKDIFENRFSLIREKSIDIDDIYKRVFNGGGSFRIYEIKNAQGEFGLKFGEGPYFGVINIGDVSGFKKLLEKEGITVEQDVISPSLFDDIKKENSSINILIGSKKFIEGWDTWRVSSMGLLNIGKGQGPQIIQLFGRGVRLKGKNMTLKRSENKEISLLETLNIYSIKADYLNKFLEAIRKEEVELEEIKIPIMPLEKEKWGKLPYLKRPDIKYEEKEVLVLNPDEHIQYTLDLTPKVTSYISQERASIKAAEVSRETSEVVISELIDLEMLDWGKILNEILHFKLMRNYYNLVFTEDSLKSILNNCKIKLLRDSFNIKSLEDVKRIEEIVILLIKGYIDRFYNKHKGKFETAYITRVDAEKQLSLFVSDKPVEWYTVYIDKNDKNDKNKKELIEDIKELAKDINKLMKEDNKTLSRVYFDKHIYVPILLSKNKDIEKISPPGLVESEEKFVIGLRHYLENNKNKFSGYEIYLLRNESKSGIGFQLDWASFYPDFIMWVKKNDKTCIVFIDPKGLHHTKLLQDEKIQFALSELKDIEQQLNQNISLEALIISNTKYDDLIKGMKNPPKKTDFENYNVLFFEDSDWCEKIFDEVIKKLNDDNTNNC